MPGESTNYKIKYSVASDEVKAFPAEVSAPGAETIDELLYKNLLRVVTHSAEVTLAPGELVKLGASIKLVLGAAGIVGVLPSSLYTAKITAGVGHTISGGGLVSPVEEITVLPGQSVLISVFESNGYIIAGEPKQSQEYAMRTPTKAEWEAGIVLSANRAVLATIYGSGTSVFSNVKVGGVTITTTPAMATLTVEVNPGQALKCEPFEAPPHLALLVK